MPDTTYKTFLSPGSCQLEVTDLVAAANDDKGVDLYGVAWEIEQVLIAGEGFAASPTDVWVNERGILNVGKSLFDKINRTAEDNDNIPGQCTVIVKATSLVDSSKVARLKVLVGYPGEGGGGGGGGSTVDMNIWNLTEDESLMTVLPTEVKYITGFDEENNQILSDPLPFEHVTVEENGTTIHGVMVSGIPVGVCVKFTFSDVDIDDSSFGLAKNGAAAYERLLVSTDDVVMAPVSGCIVVGQYYLAGSV